MDPNQRAYYQLDFESQVEPKYWTLTRMEVEKDCSEDDLNWTRHRDRILECLQIRFPDVPIHMWSPDPFFSHRFRLGIHYIHRNKTLAENCSLPGTDS